MVYPITVLFTTEEEAKIFEDNIPKFKESLISEIKINSSEVQ